MSTKPGNVNMTDTASDIADKIIALINSRPSSPSKDELVAIIGPHVQDEAVAGEVISWELPGDGNFVMKNCTFNRTDTPTHWVVAANGSWKRLA